MPKEFSEDFQTETEEVENRPLLLIEINLGETQVWRLTTLDEEIDISFSTPDMLQEP